MGTTYREDRWEDLTSDDREDQVIVKTLDGIVGDPGRQHAENSACMQYSNTEDLPKMPTYIVSTTFSRRYDLSAHIFSFEF